jgi:hypothetical protein
VILVSDKIDTLEQVFVTNDGDRLAKASNRTLLIRIEHKSVHFHIGNVIHFQVIRVEKDWVETLGACLPTGMRGEC